MFQFGEYRRSEIFIKYLTVRFEFAFCSKILKHMLEIHIEV